ncbi:prepilin-type N-terminal cleavage/methylation domain-containing protein [Thiobacter aerophilum]|uniref:Prepilin-type N-terminal cleavage/methylation domain-containing protein n=1 Tax=Thiobacter aerophilum TaxID=3121275 RepID=A0ABV0EIG9_9BURK
MRGFTLVELVVVIVILGILAVVVAPRFFDRATFDARGFSDELAQTVRFAQKLAVAQHGTIHVLTGGGQVRVCWDVACSQPAPSPAGGALTRVIPTGVSVSGPAALSFDALGRPSSGASYNVSGGGVNRTLTVEAETGYAHF